MSNLFKLVLQRKLKLWIYSLSGCSKFSPSYKRLKPQPKLYFVWKTELKGGGGLDAEQGQLGKFYQLPTPILKRLRVKPLDGLH